MKLQLLYIRESELSNVDSIVNLLLRKEEKKKIASNLFERVSLELKGIAINSTKDIDVSALLNGNTKQINEIVINGKHIPKR